MSGFSRRSLSQTTARAFALSLCIVLLLTSQRVAFYRGASIFAQSDNNERVQNRQSVPNYKMPDWDALLAEGKKTNRPELPRPPQRPSTDCGFRDDECRANKKNQQKIGQSLAPTETTPANQIALQASPTSNAEPAKIQLGWRQRLRKWVGALTSLTQAASVSTANSFAPTGNVAATKTAASATTAAFTPPMFYSVKEAQTDPHNRLGGEGEDLFSGNYHWSLPLVSLPGRAGHDLNVTLHYNSLVWIKYGSVIAFDHDYYASLTPGFRLGFPELDGPMTLRGNYTYILVMPSGRRVEMRYVTTNTFEAIDSSNYYLVTAGGTAKLFSPDGTQYQYTMPAGNGVYRCTKVVDRNGNYITINYANVSQTATPFWAISTIVDTLGRTITFLYDANFHLEKITQNWAGQPASIWAQFFYENRTINTNFATSLTKYGPTNNTTIPVIDRVITRDGARHTFVYNTWGQVEDIWTYGEGDNQRAAIDYAFPNSSVVQNDCPRFTQRSDHFAFWAGARPGPNNGGWVDSQFTFAADESYGMVTLPNGVVYKEWFGITGEQRGLLTRTETLEGTTPRQFTVYVWQSDGTAGVFPALRPRIIETEVCDDRNGNNTYQSGTDKMRRTSISYALLPGLANTTIRLPEYIYEHNEGDIGSTVYRTRKLSYLSNTDYISSTRRLVGLVSQECLYSGNVGTLVARTDYTYDYNMTESGFVFLQDHSGAVSQHEGAAANTAYQTGGQPRRGNLTKAMRYSVVGGTASAPITYKTGYHSTGTVACTTDGIDTHKTSIFYNDAFTAGVTTAPTTATWAYPTRVQDPDTNSSMVKYHLYNTRSLMTSATYTTPSGVAATNSVTFQYDQNGKRTLMNDGPGQVSYQYDSLSRLTSETRIYDAYGAPLSSQSFPLTYEYHPGGQIKKLTDASGAYVSYGRDKIGRTTDITGSAFAGFTSPGYATGLEYRAWGAPKKTVYGSGFTANATYTERLQPKIFDMYGVNGGTTTNVIGGTYTYNLAGQLTNFVAQVTRQSQVVNYFRGLDRVIGYDEFGRLNSSVAGSTDANFPDNSFRAKYNPTQEQFGNITNAAYQHWMSGSNTANFTAQFVNNKVVAGTATDQDKSNNAIPQIWTYDTMGNRTKLEKTVNNTTSTVQASSFDALGRIVAGDLDGEGRAVGDGTGGFVLRSTVFGGEIACTVNLSGRKPEAVCWMAEIW